jgi:hypothetical protein
MSAVNERIEQKVQQLKVALESNIAEQHYLRDNGNAEERHQYILEAKKLRVKIDTLVELQIELGEQA